MWVEHEMASIFSSQAYMATGTAPFASSQSIREDGMVVCQGNKGTIPFGRG